MRLLPSVIKASQYGDVGVQSQSVHPSELPRSRAAGSSPKAVKEQHQAIVNEAFHKAKDIVEAAQNYSLNQLKESAARMNEECAEMKIRSYEEGYSEGLSKGNEEGLKLGQEEGYRQGFKKAEEEFESRKTELEAEYQKKLDTAQKQISALLEAIENKKSEILTDFEEDLEGLSIAIARKVVQKELSTDETALRSIIENVLEPYRNQAWVKISISPADAPKLMKADQSIALDLHKISDNIKIVPDPNLNEGGCLVELPDRLIDAGTDTQLNEIKTKLEL